MANDTATQTLTTKPITKGNIVDPVTGKIVASHQSTIVTDPSDPLAVQEANAEDYPSANATGQDPLAVHGEQTPNEVFGDDAGYDERQTLTLTNGSSANTFTVTYSGQTTSGVAGDASAATLKTALQALSNLADADIDVTGSGGGPYTLHFEGALAAEDVASVTATGHGVDEVQTITVTSATGGTFTITYAGQTTDAIAYNATAATVKTELRGLSNLADADIASVTGSAGGPYVITFGGSLAATDVAPLTVTDSTTGSGHGVAVAETTKGVVAPTVAVATTHRGRPD